MNGSTSLKTLSSIACLAMVSTLVAVEAPAATRDVFGDYPGTLCVPSRYSATGITLGSGFTVNEGSKNETVPCPVPRIHPQGALSVEVRVNVGYLNNAKKGASDRIRCYLFATNERGDAVASDSVSYFETKTGSVTLDTPIQRTPYPLFSSTTCRLPPGAVVWSFSVRESLE